MLTFLITRWCGSGLLSLEGDGGGAELRLPAGCDVRCGRPGPARRGSSVPGARVAPTCLNSTALGSEGTLFPSRLMYRERPCLSTASTTFYRRRPFVVTNRGQLRPFECSAVNTQLSQHGAWVTCQTWMLSVWVAPSHWHSTASPARQAPLRKRRRVICASGRWPIQIRKIISEEKIEVEYQWWVYCRSAGGRAASGQTRGNVGGERWQLP